MNKSGRKPLTDLSEKKVPLTFYIKKKYLSNRKKEEAQQMLELFYEK
jgi:hypothetical protein